MAISPVSTVVASNASSLVILHVYVLKDTSATQQTKETSTVTSSAPQILIAKEKPKNGKHATKLQEFAKEQIALQTRQFVLAKMDLKVSALATNAPLASLRMDNLIVVPLEKPAMQQNNSQSTATQLIKEPATTNHLAPIHYYLT